MSQELKLEWDEIVDTELRKYPNDYVSQSLYAEGFLEGANFARANVARMPEVRELVDLASNGLSTGAKMQLENFDKFLETIKKEGAE